MTIAPSIHTHSFSFSYSAIHISMCMQIYGYKEELSIDSVLFCSMEKIEDVHKKEDNKENHSIMFYGMKYKL